MPTLFAVLLGLAMVDSLNPSAIGITIYLILSGSGYARRVLIYLAGVFVTYLSIGTLLLLYAILAPSKRGEPSRERLPRSFNDAALFALGVTISVIEFSTALPFLGAIALLGRADLPLPATVGILAGYTLVMLLPPLAILALFAVSARRLGDRLQRWRDRLRGGTRNAWLTVVGLVGFVLLADALAYFEFFGLVDLPEPVPPT